MHAQEIINEAKIFNSFEEALKNIEYLVATSSIESLNDKRHLRNAIFLEDLSENLLKINGNIGLIFGREDYGLFNEEIAKCDVMLKIPTSENYLSLNLSHAVAVVLYSLFIKKEIEIKEKSTIGKIEKEKLYIFFKELLEKINYPEHKKEKVK